MPEAHVSFGAPVDQPDDSIRAVQAAIAMQQRAGQIDALLAAKAKSRLSIGIEMARGKVFSGKGV